MSETDDASRRLIEASAWRVHLTEIGLDSTPDFEVWLFADPRNLEVWRRVEAPWDFVGVHAAEPEIVAARSVALGLPGFGRRPGNQAVLWPKIAAALLLVLTGLAGGIFWWLQPTDYQTELGERRTLTLADGSRLSLDSDSEVKVSYSLRNRELELVRGQARFEVAHDTSRPFLVTANRGVLVRATGTDFDVNLPSQSVIIALLQGRVAVTDANYRTALNAGEQLTLMAGQPPRVSPASSSDVLAWLGGQVVFHNAPLSSVLERLNHYDKAQLVLGDPRLADRRVSGTFNTGDAVAVAEILARYLAIHVIYSDTGRIELRS